MVESTDLPRWLNLAGSGVRGRRLRGHVVLAAAVEAGAASVRNEGKPLTRPLELPLFVPQPSLDLTNNRHWSTSYYL